VGGEAFAVDASIIVADAQRRKGVAKVGDLDPTSNRPVGPVQHSERLMLICLPNSAPRSNGFAEYGRRASDSGQVGQGPQTTVYLPSEPGMSRVTWHPWGDANAETGPLKAEPIAGADGLVSAEEFPYPSTVTGV
jgi:hypothetical protein